MSQLSLLHGALTGTRREPLGEAGVGDVTHVVGDDGWLDVWNPVFIV